MNRISPILLVFLAFLSGLAGAWVWLATHGSSASPEKARETAYERVMRAQTFRCGYGDWPPFVSKDPNSGQMSGIFYDYMEALGHALHLKIEWPLEVNAGDFAEAIKDGRVDGICVGVWPNATRAREIDFTHPIYYTGLYTYTRAEDARFDKDASAINDPSVTIVAQDGEMAALIANSDFPKAKILPLPQLASISEFFVNIAMRKADVTFANPSIFALYEAQNPGKIKRASEKPVRVFGNTIAVARGENDLRRMIDTATEELLSSGQIETILARYEKAPGMFLRVAPPYRTEAASSPPR